MKSRHLITFILIATILTGCHKDAQITNYPTGAIKGLFSVSSLEQVCFSQGNLQYQASTDTWRFAEHQYDVVGNSNSNISSSYSGWIDLFGWGTSGYDGQYPYMTSTLVYNYDIGLIDTASINYDWGVYNAIINGGNQAGRWRSLTKDELHYLFYTRSTRSGIRYANACVNGMNGLILLPDYWDSGTYPLSNTNEPYNTSYSSNTISASQWANMEQHGAVFLPAAGYRLGTSVNNVGSHGYYWLYSCDYDYYGYHAYSMCISNSYLDPSNGGFSFPEGFSVRLVCNAQ